MNRHLEGIYGVHCSIVGLMYFCIFVIYHVPMLFRGLIRYGINIGVWHYTEYLSLGTDTHWSNYCCFDVIQGICFLSFYIKLLISVKFFLGYQI